VVMESTQAKSLGAARSMPYRCDSEPQLLIHPRRVLLVANLFEYIRMNKCMTKIT